MPERAAPERRRRSFRAIVRDESMRPTLHPGDRLWVERPRDARAAPSMGAIVVVRDPELPSRLLVKRVAFVGPGKVWSTRRGFEASRSGQPPTGAVEEWEVPRESLMVGSDQPERSRDSRRFGPVPLDHVLGTVWFRYAPPLHRGPVGPGAGSGADVGERR